MIIGNKKGLLSHLPVSYHDQHHLLLLWKSIILTQTQPKLQEVRKRTALRVIQMDGVNGHQAHHTPGLPPHRPHNARMDG